MIKESDYDYDGVFKVTHYEDDIIYVLTEALDEDITWHVSPDVLESDDFNDNFKKMLEQTSSMRTILEEHIPILFQTLPEKHDLKETILKLLQLIIGYRNDRAHQNNVKEINKLSPTHRNKSDAEREGAFIKHIEALHLMMGGFTVGTEKGNELKRILEYAHDHPKEYLLNRSKAYTASLKPIKEYLVSLKLYKRSNEIEALLNAIESTY